MAASKTKTVVAIVVGLICGAIVYHATVLLTDPRIVEPDEFAGPPKRIEVLGEDNQSHSDDPDGLFPYDDTADARVDVAAARVAAIQNSRFLMITFGANWCVDCRTLYRTLRRGDVAEYTSGRFAFANVNVGEFNRNLDVAAELGVSLERGIPVAIFYDQAGELIGTTNGGELEPARLYSSKQILRFVRDIAERSQIRAPNSMQ